MRAVLAVPEGMADQEKIQRLVESLKKVGGGPLMVREIAIGMKVSLTTAGKYVDVAQAKGLVRVTPYASAKQVWLVDSNGKGGVGVR
jgi:Mn-dependent DtxR family transcriptional regulator